MSRRLDAIPIDRPIFVTGLARSGTTILLTVLSRSAGVATHRYRDFPFLDIPLLWNWFQDRFARELPGSAVAEVAGAGHSVMGDNPAGFLAAVRPFLARHGL